MDELQREWEDQPKPVDAHMDGLHTHAGVNCPGCGSPRAKQDPDAGQLDAMWCPDCEWRGTEHQARAGKWSAGAA
jgi:hypothetical protein